MKKLLALALILFSSLVNANGVPHTFATLPAGNVPASYLDDNFAVGGTYTPFGTGAVVTTAQSKLQQTMSFADFLPNGYVTDGSVNYYSNLVTAITAATNANMKLRMPAGEFSMSGGSGSVCLSVDIGHMSIESEGRTILDFSSATCTYAIQVFSSLSFPYSQYENTTNPITGISIIGGGVTGRIGWYIGHATYQNNSQIRLQNCAAYNFDTNLYFTNNAWRFSADNCVFEGAVTFTIYIPAGLSNFGESIDFFHCMFSDGGAISIGTNGGLHFFGSSVLNVPIVESASGNSVNFYGGNIENPGSGLIYVWATISGNNSFIAFYGTTLTFDLSNTAIQNAAPFLVTGSNSYFSFYNTLFPVSNNFQTELSSPDRVLVNGAAFSTNGGMVTNYSNSNPVLSLQSNLLSNGTFELGNTSGWTVAPYGGGSPTAVASATAAKNGSYGLLATSTSTGGLMITQSAPVNPGQFVTIGGWVKIAANLSGTAGYFQLSFFDRAGNQLGATVGNSLTGSGSWSWGWFNAQAPMGAATVTVTLNVQPGGSGSNVIYFDDIIVNIL